MREKVLQILQECSPDVDFLASNTLVEDGILDSLLLISIVSALSTELGIMIPYTEISEKNFNSVDAITAMVERIQKG